MIKVLLVEDSAADARLLREALKEPGPRTFIVTHVPRLSDAIAWPCSSRRINRRLSS